jgi:hypothetical protein
LRGVPFDEISRRKGPLCGRAGRSDVNDIPGGPATLAGKSPARNGSEPESGGYPVPASFPELVLAHYDWRLAVAEHRPSADLEENYHQKLDRFQQKYGPIVNSYWCLSVPSAVALTEKPRRGPLRWFGRPKLEFHRVTDWATRGKPATAAMLHQCDEIAIRASQVLTGLRERIATQLVMASAAHLLSIVDEPSAHWNDEKVLEQEERNLSKAWKYYCDAANGHTQMIYFAGMGFFAVVLGVVAALSAFFTLPGIDHRAFFGALLAGALGAVVSVVARINSGRFDVEYDVGRFYPFFLGGLRPLIGGIFGLGLYFAATSGLLDIIPTDPAGDDTDPLNAILVIAFVAGFSERWAKDTLAVAAGGQPSEEAAGPRARRDLLQEGVKEDQAPTDGRPPAQRDDPRGAPL